MSAKSAAPIATVLLVDDERHVTEGLEVILRRAGYDVLCACSAEEGRSILGRCTVDVIVCDEHMPGTGGSQFLGQIARDFPSTARILLTGKATLEVALAAINGGKVTRFLRKPCPPSELLDAVSEAAREAIASAATAQLLRVARLEQGRVESDTEATQNLASHRFGSLTGEELSVLSARELEVLALLLDGLRVAQIAKALFLSPHTARNHLKSIFRKLDAHSQEELLARAKFHEPRARWSTD